MGDDRTEELKKNILSPSQWIRIFFMIIYGVICWVLTFVIAAIVVVQALISLITGEDNHNLRRVGDQIADYYKHLIRFLVYATEAKPWPFSDQDADNPFSGSDGDSDNESYGEPDPADDYQADSGTEDTPGEPEKPVNDASGDDVFADMSFTESGDQPSEDTSGSEEEDIHSVDFNAGDEESDESAGGAGKENDADENEKKD